MLTVCYVACCLDGKHPFETVQALHSASTTHFLLCPRTTDNAQAEAKRPRLAASMPAPDPTAYGRCTSDPPYSIQRRLANAANLPISVLDGRLVFPPQAETRHLPTIRSGPARSVTITLVNCTVRLCVTLQVLLSYHWSAL